MMRLRLTWLIGEVDRGRLFGGAWMMIVPFSDDLIEAAGQLLAGRHARDRSRLPILPGRFEDADVAARAVAGVWTGQYRTGFAALLDGVLVGYMIGEMVVQSWGRVGYVYLPGYGLAAGESVQVLQDLYAQLGEVWVKKGIFIHDVYVSAANDEVVGAFFDLGFGKERVEGLLDLTDLEAPVFEAPEGLTLREAEPGDAELLAGLSGIIAQALAGAPYWHVSATEEVEERREGWAGLASDADWRVWLALDGAAALGMVGLTPEPEGDVKMLVPPETVYFSLGVTVAEARGRGVGTVLSWQALAEARRAGFKMCYINWISPNLLAARFWPRFGFTVVGFRLAKRVGGMVAWARQD